MILTLTPRILASLRVGKSGPAFIDIRPCRGGARLTALNGHTVSVVASGADGVPLRVTWADFLRMAKMAGKTPVLINATHCYAGGFTFPVTTMAPDPETPRPSKVRLRLDDAVVTDLFARLLPAMCVDETRTRLFGMHVERRTGVLTFAVTDGHRMHRKTLPSAGRDFAVLLPADAVRSLARLRGDLTLRLEEPLDAQKRVLLRRGRDWVQCESVDATFPDLGAVVPSEWEHTVEVDVVALRRVLAIVEKQGLDTSHRPGNGTARMEWADGLRISTAVFLGDVLGRMVADTIPATGGLVGAVSVQARYLLGALGREGPVTMRFSGALDPVMVESDGMLAVVMPCRDDPPK